MVILVLICHVWVRFRLPGHCRPKGRSWFPVLFTDGTCLFVVYTCFPGRGIQWRCFGLLCKDEVQTSRTPPREICWIPIFWSHRTQLVLVSVCYSGPRINGDVSIGLPCKDEVDTSRTLPTKGKLLISHPLD